MLRLLDHFVDIFSSVNISLMTHTMQSDALRACQFYVSTLRTLYFMPDISASDFAARLFGFERTEDTLVKFLVHPGSLIFEDMRSQSASTPRLQSVSLVVNEKKISRSTQRAIVLRLGKVIETLYGFGEHKGTIAAFSNFKDPCYVYVATGCCVDSHCQGVHAEINKQWFEGESASLGLQLRILQAAAFSTEKQNSDERQTVLRCVTQCTIVSRSLSRCVGQSLSATSI